MVDVIQRAKDARALLLQEINGKIWLHEIAGIAQGEILGNALKAFQRLKSQTEKSDLVAINTTYVEILQLRQR